MKLVTPDQIPPAVSGFVARQSPLVTTLNWVLLLLLAGVPLAIVLVGRPPVWFSVPLTLLAVFIAWKIGRAAFRVFGSENWLLQIATDGLWINLRSYQNRDFAPAATVLFLPYDEISGVSQHSVKRSERKSKNVATWTDQYLDIRLAAPAIPELSAEIAEERRRRTTNEYFGGKIKSRGRSNHVPVTVPTDTTVRLAWRGQGDYVVPVLDAALGKLAARCTVVEATARDLSDVKSLTSEQIDSLILERVETGDTIGAMKLLQEHRGNSLTEAKNFVKELTAKL